MRQCFICGGKAILECTDCFNTEKELEKSTFCEMCSKRVRSHSIKCYLTQLEVCIGLVVYWFNPKYSALILSNIGFHDSLSLFYWLVISCISVVLGQRHLSLLHHIHLLLYYYVNVNRELSFLDYHYFCWPELALSLYIVVSSEQAQKQPFTEPSEANRL